LTGYIFKTHEPICVVCGTLIKTCCCSEQIC